MTSVLEENDCLRKRASALRDSLAVSRRVFFLGRNDPADRPAGASRAEKLPFS